MRLKDTACGRCVRVAGWVVVFGRMLSDSHDSWLCMTAADGVRAVVPFSAHARVVGVSDTFRCMVRCVRCMISKVVKAHVVRA